MEEQDFCKVQVAGSSPVIGSNKIKKKKRKHIMKMKFKYKRKKI